jgi:cell division protein FtsA
MARDFKRSADRKLVAALDIGASKVACVIAELADAFDGEFEVDVVGVGQHGATLRDKAPDFDVAIRAAVEAAERMAGERIRHVHVAAAGRSLTTRRVGVDLDIEGGVITREDVSDCMLQGSGAAAPDGATALHAFKIRYAIDGEPAPDDPVGLSGAVLNAEIFGVGVKDSYIANLESMAARAGLELDEIVAAPYAAAEAVLIDDEKELGVLLLDFGARSTSYALYERGALIACGGVGIGGEHITRDIAQIFGSPIAHAERMKTLHGSVLTGPGDEHRLLDFPQLGDGAEIVRHSKAELAQVIAPRFEEILEMALAALPGGVNARRSVRRAVLDGGEIDRRQDASWPSSAAFRCAGSSDCPAIRRRLWRVAPHCAAALCAPAGNCSPARSSHARRRAWPHRRRRSVAQGEFLNRAPKRKRPF